MNAAIAGCATVMPHVHLPLQSASDPILQAMKRTYSIVEYREVVTRLRRALPDLALTTDVIVGFPGESEADFQRTFDYLRETRYDSAFLFKYSARPDTKAFALPETVSDAEKGQRLSRLIEMQHAISGELNDALLGREVEVLVEGPSRRGEPIVQGLAPGAATLDRKGGEETPNAERSAEARVRPVAPAPVQLYGKSREYKTVVFDDDGSPAGTLRRVRVVGATAITLIGRSATAPRHDPELVQLR